MKIKIVLPFLVIFAILSSCKKEVAKVPNRLIEEDKMVNIMYDMAVLDAMRNQNPSLLDSFKNNSNAYIYKKHKIDSVQFAQSNIYYAADFKAYKKLYEQVKIRLDKEKISTEAIIKVEKKKMALLEKKNKKLKVKRVADSIKKAKLKMKKEIDSLKKAVEEEKKRRVQIKN
jgi:outer membrane protein assembly factor BamE (lipoprotein component of BamABCDE complex)